MIRCFADKIFLIGGWEEQIKTLLVDFDTKSFNWKKKVECLK